MTKRLSFVSSRYISAVLARSPAYLVKNIGVTTVWNPTTGLSLPSLPTSWEAR